MRSLPHLRYFNPRPLTRSDSPSTDVPSVVAFISIHAPLTRSDPLRKLSYCFGFISIHAPLTRSDAILHTAIWSIADFNPRPSYEERLYLPRYAAFTAISIHAPLTRSDAAFENSSAFSAYFNPRPSYEERRAKRAWSARTLFRFQSTPLLRGATAKQTKLSVSIGERL